LEVQALLSKALVALRKAALAAFDYREAARSAIESRAAFNRVAERSASWSARSRVRETSRRPSST
jgi:hypothetical protein